MSYRLKRKESVEHGIQRIAREQIDKALDELDNDQLDRHETVHQVRKRCKKIRTVLRLVRPQFEDLYDCENAFFRDAASRLSGLRDAEALIETYDDLVKHFDDQVDREAFASVRRALTLRKQKLANEQMDLDKRLDEFKQSMHKARKRVENWTLDDKGFDAVKGGLAKTYSRGVKAMEKAYDDPTTERFHEWRKRVKYHWYHMRILRDLWKPVIKSRRDELSALADLLGDEHDLAVFHDTVTTEPDAFGQEQDVQALLGLIEQRRMELRAAALPLGERVFAEKPKHLIRRFRTYWKAWHEQESKPTVQPPAHDVPVPVTA